MTVVHLLRHGLVHNPTGVLYGRLPGFELSESGRAMAEGVAEYLAGSDITYLASSPLTRAQQTAAPLAATLGLPVTADERLIEASNIFEGMRVAVGDGALREPRNWPKLRDPFTPSWGEPYLAIAQRMIGAVYAALAAADGHQAVLVSHQLPIWVLRRWLTGHRLWHNPSHRQCAVASLTSLHFADGVFRKVVYSEPVAHIVGEVYGVEAGA